MPTENVGDTLFIELPNITGGSGVPDTIGAPYTTAVVTFPDNPNTGAALSFTTTQITVEQ